jgi:hypothetical protein
MAVISKEFMSIFKGALREDLEKAYDKIEKDIDMSDIVERLRNIDVTFWYSPAHPEEKFKPIEIGKISHEAADEIERLRKANKRLGEIATDAVEWLPPASVNGPREKYQNEIKELTDGPSLPDRTYLHRLPHPDHLHSDGDQ